MICGFSWLLLLAMFTFYVSIGSPPLKRYPPSGSYKQRYDGSLPGGPFESSRALADALWYTSRRLSCMSFFPCVRLGTSLAAFQRSYRSSPDRASTKRPSDSESPACVMCGFSKVLGMDFLCSRLRRRISLSRYYTLSQVRLRWCL